LRRSFRTQRPAGRSIAWIEHCQTARGAGRRKYETPWSVISSLRRNNVPAALIRRDTFSRLNTAPPNREMVAVRSRDNVWLPFFVRDSKAICDSLCTCCRELGCGKPLCPRENSPQRDTVQIAFHRLTNEGIDLLIGAKCYIVSIYPTCSPDSCDLRL